MLLVELLPPVRSGPKFRAEVQKTSARHPTLGSTVARFGGATSGNPTSSDRIENLRVDAVNTLAVVGRLRIGATIEAARGELAALAKSLEQAHPDRNKLRPLLKPLAVHAPVRSPKRTSGRRIAPSRWPTAEVYRRTR